MTKPNIGLDGFARRSEDDERISLDIAALFSKPSGKSVTTKINKPP